MSSVSELKNVRLVVPRSATGADVRSKLPHHFEVVEVDSDFGQSLRETVMAAQTPVVVVLNQTAAPDLTELEAFVAALKVGAELGQA
jgi:hypothetical protein